MLRSFGDPSAPRSASDPSDYVAAIWVECPEYKLPLDYKSWDLSSLLENAIQQLEKNWTFSPAVSFPSDLSTIVGPVAAGLWRPATYSSEIDIHKESDVYGPILQHPIVNFNYPTLAGKHVFTTNGENEDMFYTDVRVTSERSLGSTAIEYPHVYGPENAFEMMQDLLSVSAHWPEACSVNAYLRCERLTESRLCQMRLCQMRLCQMRLCQMRLCQMRLCQMHNERPIAKLLSKASKY